MADARQLGLGTPTSRRSSGPTRGTRSLSLRGPPFGLPGGSGPQIQPPMGGFPGGMGGVTGTIGAIARRLACAQAGLPSNCTPEDIAIALGTKLIGGGNGNGGEQAVSCPEPLVYDESLGHCIFVGSPGEVSVQDVTDVTPDVGAGMFGLMSYEPVVVGQTVNGPIRRCPIPGTVLGKDNRCYVRGGEAGITNRQRKWPKRKHKGRCDRDLDAIKSAGSAIKRMKRKFKGTGFKVTKTGR